jgi:hydroxyacylglutathione hydrolase
VKRIQLENSFFEGLNNAYLFDGDGPTTLVDTGVATDNTRAQLVEKLGESEVEFADVDQILLTHWHADHVGLAGEIQAESGATVRVHRGDQPLVEQTPDAEEANRDRMNDLLTQWGMPEPAQEQLRAFLDGGEGLGGDPPTVEPFEAGDRFQAGEETLEVMHLPGHTEGLCGFVRVDEAGAELFSGDALLPEYTPNVGGADTRVDRPLEKYLSTLAGIEDRSFAVAHPGHRYPIEEPAARAREIIDHHRDRTERVLGALGEHETADAWTVSAHLFGDLENIHILHGPGEAYAHLEHLREHDIVERENGAYTSVVADPDIDALFP